MQRLMVSLFLLLASLTVVTAAPAAERGPKEVVATLNAALLDAMKRGRELGYGGRYRLLAPVINESFALPRTARTATGRYWSTFTEEQQQTYLKIYSEWTVATYAGRFKSFSGERFTAPKETPSSRGTVTVTSRLVPADGDEVEFEYQLRKTGGTWRIADIRIEGVSQLALTRSQFVSVLRKKGFEGLVSALNDKIGKLSSGKVS